jgi:glycerol-3-phosphate dehydrogenase (NAD(P)+)
MSRVAVMGSGSWGTAFAMILADAGGDVVMWSRDADIVRQINDDHVNERYHPGIRLPAGLRATSDEREALDGAPLVVLAVPAQSLRDNLARWRDDLAPGSVLVSLMKGIESGTTLRMSQVIEEVAQIPPARVAVVSGPNLAR